MEKWENNIERIKVKFIQKGYNRFKQNENYVIDKYVL